jgi:hypothetical protein
MIVSGSPSALSRLFDSGTIRVLSGSVQGSTGGWLEPIVIL